MLPELGGLGFLVHPESPAETVDPPLLDTRDHEPIPEIVVHDVVKRLVDLPDLFVDLLREEGRGAEDHKRRVRRLEKRRVPVRPPSDLDHAAILREAIEIPGEPLAIRMTLHFADDLRETTVRHDVVGIQPGEILAPRMGKPLVERGGLAAVLLAAPPGEDPPTRHEREKTPTGFIDGKRIGGRRSYESRPGPLDIPHIMCYLIPRQEHFRLKWRGIRPARRCSARCTFNLGALVFYRNQFNRLDRIELPAALVLAKRQHGKIVRSSENKGREHAEICLDPPLSVLRLSVFMFEPEPGALKENPNVLCRELMNPLALTGSQMFSQFGGIAATSNGGLQPQKRINVDDILFGHKSPLQCLERVTP